MANTLLFRSRSEFREWLSANALSGEGIWLVSGKDKGPETLKASEALEEALCFGWIDGQMRSVDDESYVKYFRQRSSSSDWSERNKRLVETLESRGLMTDFGRAKIEIAKQSGHWNPPRPEPLTDEQLQQFDDMLQAYADAHANFSRMPRSARRAYAASYFLGARTDAGRQERFSTIVERLKMNLNPMESITKKPEDGPDR